MHSTQAVQALRMSRAELVWLVENAPGHLKVARDVDPGLFSQELELAAEMAELQRHNIEHLERRWFLQQQQQ